MKRMSFKRLVNIVCILISSFFVFAGCKAKDGYPYMNNTDEIKSIEIVLVNKNKDVYGHDLQTTLVVIEEKTQFIQDLSAIEFRHVFGYAYGVADGETAVKLIYSNNDYELITAVGIARYRASDDDYTHNAGTYTCSAEDFDALISKYMLKKETN